MCYKNPTVCISKSSTYQNERHVLRPTGTDIFGDVKTATEPGALGGLVSMYKYVPSKQIKK